MFKKFISIFFVLLILLNLFSGFALAGQWLSVDTSSSKVWIDTSHWENHPYQAWVDTSHYEWKQYQVLVSSGYWQPYGFVDPDYWVGLWESETLLSGYWDNDVLLDDAQNSGDNRLTDWAGGVVPSSGLRNWAYTATTRKDYYNDNGDGTYRHLWRYWSTLERRTDWPWEFAFPYAVDSRSDGYHVQYYGTRYKWIDTSYYEYPWGNVWVTEGHYELRDNWVWVVSGYWDESHGTVSIAKSPKYIFTKLTEQNDGDVMHMDLDVSWSMNKNVTKVEAYHDVNRYRNKGMERIYGSNLKIIGLGTPQGNGTYRFEYNHPGDTESLLYVEFTFENGTKVRVYAKIPINGIATTEKLTAPDPVFDHSLMDADSVSF